MMPVDKERLILLIGRIDESLNILKKSWKMVKVFLKIL